MRWSDGWSDCVCVCLVVCTTQWFNLYVRVYEYEYCLDSKLAFQLRLSFSSSSSLTLSHCLIGFGFDYKYLYKIYGEQCGAWTQRHQSRSLYLVNEFIRWLFSSLLILEWDMKREKKRNEWHSWDISQSNSNSMFNVHFEIDTLAYASMWSPKRVLDEFSVVVNSQCCFASLAAESNVRAYGKCFRLTHRINDEWNRFVVINKQSLFKVDICSQIIYWLAISV